MSKVIYNVASYKRGDTLIKTIESIYHQCDVINVALNDYSEIPIELYDNKINLFITNNEKGDAYKFFNLINSDGYYFTVDDDLIYPENYTEFMIGKIEEYQRKSIISLHGRSFTSYPINSYYSRNATVNHFRQELIKDTEIEFGGTGVMAFHTDLFKVDIDYFEFPNMADVWIGKYAKDSGIKIICAKHPSNFVQQQEFDECIYATDLKNDEIQTKIVNESYVINDFSIIVPTFNNVDYIDECLDSIIRSCKNYSYDVLVGIDNCEKTLEYIKTKSFNKNIRFYYFNTNVGPYVIKNTLANISKSKYLLFFDSDDIMNENMIDTIYPLQENCDFVKPMMIDFKHGDNPYMLNLKPTNRYGEGVFSIRRSLFMVMNGFEGWRCAADSDFMNRLSKNDRTYRYTPKIVFFRRVHSQSLTQKPETNMGSSMRSMYAKISNERTDFGPLPKLHIEKFSRINTKTHYHNPEKNGKQHLNSISYEYDMTIIIPTYDNVDYIDECVESIIKNSNGIRIEILIGIDGCKKTLEHLQKNKYSGNIRIYYFEKNVGPYIIKNSLSKHSKSKYLLFFDSDDTMVNNMTSKIYNELSNFDCVKPMFINVKNNKLINDGSKNWGEGVFGIKKDVFLIFNGFEPWRCAADSEFMNRLYRNNIKVKMTNEILFHRRLHDKNLTVKQDTNYHSKLRSKYYNLSIKKTDFGPLHTLHVENHIQVNIDNNYPKSIEETVITNKEKLDVIRNTVPIIVQEKPIEQDIDYEATHREQKRLILPKVQSVIRQIITPKQEPSKLVGGITQTNQKLFQNKRR